MAHTDSPIVTRFAPSPTGNLHVGGARTALFAWAIAQRARNSGAGGRFVLRIEDTDLKRSSEEASRGILEDLAWLGLSWDDGPEFESGDTRIGGDERGVGPFYQSQRKDLYDAFVQRLVDADLAYPAFDTPEELDAMRAEAQAAKKTFVYRRPEGYDRDAMLERAAAEEHVVRFKMPPEAVTVRDEVLGDVTVPFEELDDFIIRKRDGMPTYHFAVVVDDELMGVTDVVRGQEHLNNTPRHAALIRALRHEDGREFRMPRFAHLPVIANPDNSKMSKRDRDKAARAKCREVGVEALVQIHGRVGVGEGDFHAWLEDKTRQLPGEPLERLAAAVGVDLPEVAVDDFRRSGYLPEVLLNYLALLGWNSGEKDDEGKNIERFDLGWFVERFELSRVGKGSSK
ncbi:MAG: glutamate--tRNA ligase, partial [Phycisphaerales bacterium]